MATKTARSTDPERIADQPFTFKEFQFKVWCLVSLVFLCIYLECVPGLHKQKIMFQYINDVII